MIIRRSDEDHCLSRSFWYFLRIESITDTIDPKMIVTAQYMASWRTGGAQ